MSLSKFYMPWPRYPTVTPGGKESLAKNAGRPLPWLSANYINRVQHRQHRSLVHLWRDCAAARASRHGVFVGTFDTYPYILDITLYRQRGYQMDSYAILEGMKPIIDGIVAAGLLPDDTQEYIIGGIARSKKASGTGVAGIHVSFLTAKNLGYLPVQLYGQIGSSLNR